MQRQANVKCKMKNLEDKMANQISEKAREARNAYMRQWRKNNPERVSEINSRYWERKAAKLMNESKEVDNAE